MKARGRENVVHAEKLIPLFNVFRDGRRPASEHRFPKFQVIDVLFSYYLSGLLKWFKPDDFICFKEGAGRTDGMGLQEGQKDKGDGDDANEPGFIHGDLLAGPVPKEDLISLSNN